MSERSAPPGRVKTEVEERETRVLPSGEVVTRTKVTRTFAAEEPETEAEQPPIRVEEFLRPTGVRLRELVAQARTRWARDMGRPTGRLDAALPELVQYHGLERVFSAMVAARGRFPRAGADALVSHFIALLRDARKQQPGGTHEGEPGSS